MPANIETPVTGRATTSVRVNLRQGKPSTAALIVRKLEAGMELDVTAIAVGDAVAGNAQWYRTPDGYVWSGGCTAFRPLESPTASQPVPLGNLPAVPRVVDLYHGNGVASFATARAAGLLGVIHKATTGATGRDDAYRRRRDSAREAGLLWGAYHWGTAADVDRQVDNFLEWAAPDAETLLALDYEPTVGNQMTLAQARDFLGEISTRVGRKAVLYSGHLIKEQLGQTADPFFGGHRLWLAQYGTIPRTQASWSTYWLWQYTDGVNGPGPRTVPGIPGNHRGHVDCNHFAGTEEDLRNQWADG